MSPQLQLYKIIAFQIFSVQTLIRVTVSIFPRNLFENQHCGSDVIAKAYNCEFREFLSHEPSVYHADKTKTCNVR